MIRAAVSRLQPYVPGEQPGGDVVKLNTNENPYPPSLRVSEALRAFDAGALRRYASPTAEPVRQAVADLHGCGIDRVFVGNGSDEILALCTRAFVEADGAIGYFDPSYSLYPVLAAIADVPQCPTALAGRYDWRDPDDSCELFFLTNPNAPTGVRYPEATVAAFCERFTGTLVIDEAYADFATASCMGLATRYAHVLVTRSLSKSYSLAGLRIGYAIGHPRLIRALDAIKDSYNVNAISQCLAVAALQDQEWMQACRSRIVSTRNRLGAALAERGFDVTPSETNFLWVAPPGGRASELSEKLRAQRIVIRYFPGPVTGTHVRITIGTDAEVDALLAALDRIGYS